MVRTKRSEVDQLQRYLHRLQVDQKRDLRILQAYKEKKIPGHTAFVTRIRNETRYRAERIENLKERLKSVEKRT